METVGPWDPSFMNCQNIIMKNQTGKLAVSPERQEKIEGSVSFFGKHLQNLISGKLDEQNIYNADETYFMIHMNDCRTLGF